VGGSRFTLPGFMHEMQATDYESHRFALSPSGRAAMYGLTHRFATTTWLADVTRSGHR